MKLHTTQVIIEQLDILNYKQVEELAKKLEGVPIDILLNNAGMKGVDLIGVCKRNPPLV